MSLPDLASIVRKKLKHRVIIRKPTQWLDTKDKELNGQFGSVTKGIPFGRVFELAGPESSGKTTLALILASKAQKFNKAFVIVIDCEQTFDYDWANKLGLATDVKNFTLVQPYMTIEAKEEIVSPAEMLFDEAKEMIQLLAKYNRPIFMIVDSIPGLQPRAAATDMGDASMYTDKAIPSFLNRLLNRWVGLIANHNVALFFINQLRDNMAMFGPPERTPGGRAIRFYASVRVYMKRYGGKKGDILSKLKRIGIQGQIRNVKNKSGDGSLEQRTSHYRIFYDGKRSPIFEPEETKQGA